MPMFTIVILYESVKLTDGGDGLRSHPRSERSSEYEDVYVHVYLNIILKSKNKCINICKSRFALNPFSIIR